MGVVKQQTVLMYKPPKDGYCFTKKNNIMNKNRSIRVAAFCLGLMLAGSLQVHAQKVTFRDGTVSLKQAFEKIEASSMYKIAYNDSHLNVSR